MRAETIHCLERIEDLMDPAHLRRIQALHAACRRYEPIPHLPLVTLFSPPDWPRYNYQEILADREHMLVSELAGVYAGCLLKDDRLPSVRANYGTSILPSLFGCAVHTFSDNLPVALALHDTDKIRALVDAGVPDLRAGQGGAVLDTVAFYKEAFAPYPKIREWVSINLADTQGPMDAAEIVWGGTEMFVELYENPALAHRFLGLITDTMAAFTRVHQAIDGQPFDGACGPWGALGRVCVREDASVCLSGEMYDTFCKPYTQRLLDTFGGCIHWCGDGKAWWRSLIRLRHLSGVNPLQGQYYDPVEMHEACRTQHVMIWQWSTGLTPAQRERIRTGFSLIQWAADLEAAQRAYATHVDG